MADERLKLPGASLEELEKIIEAYSHKAGPSANEEIAQVAGSSKGTVSRCNGFLVGVGLIEGGMKKEATELGRKLGLALHHGQDEEARKYWGTVVEGNEFLSEQVTAVRVQKAVKKEELPPKILYNSGNKKTKHTAVGSRTVADILLRAGALTDEDGAYAVQKGLPRVEDRGGPGEAEEPTAVDTASPPDSAASASPPGKPARKSRQAEQAGYQLAVNLQIQIHEFEDTSKYDDLFRALRRHLMPDPGDG